MAREPFPTLATPTLGPRHYRGAYEAHMHDHAQVLVGLDGILEVEVDGHAHVVDAACGLIVPAGAAHAFEAPAPARLMVLDSPARRGLARCRGFVLPPRWRQQLPTFDVEQALDAVIGAPRRLERRTIRLDAIDGAIDADLRGRWTTARLAALCGLSAQRFHARFVELTGATPADHVRRRRLLAAQQHLRAGWPLDTTALHVGYATASALAHALRRDCGVGARRLRQRA